MGIIFCSVVDPGCGYSKSLRMLPLVLVVAIVLLVVANVFLKIKAISVRRITGSFVKGILITVVVLSVAISLSIVSTDVAFICDVRYIDFAINVCNAIYFCIPLGYFASNVITSPRVVYFIVRYIIPSFLVIVQIVLAGVAHFTRADRGEKISVHFCYDERRKPLVAISYCYGLTLLVACSLLMLLKLCRSRTLYVRSGKIEMFSVALLSMFIIVIYLVSLSFVLLPKDETDCGRHADSLVALALFPAMISLLGFIFGIVGPVYKRIKQCYVWIAEAQAGPRTIL